MDVSDYRILQFIYLTLENTKLERQQMSPFQFRRLIIEALQNRKYTVIVFPDGTLSGEFFDTELDCDSKFTIRYYSGNAVTLAIYDVTPKGEWVTKYIYTRQDEMPEVNIMDMVETNK